MLNRGTSEQCRSCWVFLAGVAALAALIFALNVVVLQRIASIGVRATAPAAASAETSAGGLSGSPVPAYLAPPVLRFPLILDCVEHTKAAGALPGEANESSSGLGPVGLAGPEVTMTCRDAPAVGNGGVR
jgi:hypothetical protein